MPAKEKISGANKTRRKGRKTRASDASPVQSLPNFCDYGVGILEQRLKKLLSHAEGARSGSDTEAIHQMRVWSRRSRAALDVFGGCFTGHATVALACMEREVKNVTRALGEARDLDVMMETLRVRAESLPPEQQAGVESFLAHLHAQRDERQQAVTRAVTRLEKRRLGRVLRHTARHLGYKAVTLAAPSIDSAITSSVALFTEPAPTGLTVSIKTLDADLNGRSVSPAAPHRTPQNQPEPDQSGDGHRNSERNHHG